MGRRPVDGARSVRTVRSDLVNLALDIHKHNPMTAGKLTTIVELPGHPVAAYIDALLAGGIRSLPVPDDVGIVVAPDPLSVGERGTAGTAFGWWVRLTLCGAASSISEAQKGRFMLPMDVRDVLETVDARIQNGSLLTGPGVLERTAVVLAWCEQVWRAGPAAAASSPLLSLNPMSRPTDALDLVPDRLADQVAKLGALADDDLLPRILAALDVTHGPGLDREPIKADGDIAIDGTLIDLKTTGGAKTVHGLRFRLRAPLIRQLIGYALLDLTDRLHLNTVGIYAARYGTTWSAPLDALLTATRGEPTTLADARAGFAALWSGDDSM